MSTGDPPDGESQPYPQYQQPHWVYPPVSSGGPAPGVPPAPPPQQRSRSRWWIAAVLLIVGGIAVGGFLVARAVLAFTATDATIAADGEPRTVELSDTDERMVWVEEGTLASCTIVDARTGEEIRTTGLGATSYTKSGPSGSWEGSATFEPPSPELEATCEAGGGRIQIGPAVSGGAFAGGLVLGILAAVGGIVGGVVWLVVLGVSSRRRRQHPWTTGG